MNRRCGGMLTINHSANIVTKVWNYCNLFRDEGISYGDYLEQLTYLLSPQPIGDPDVLAVEIIDNFESGLESFKEIAESLKQQPCQRTYRVAAKKPEVIMTPGFFFEVSSTRGKNLSENPKVKTSD